MKTKDQGPSLIELFDRFNSDEAARLHLESIRWADGVVCPHCGNNDQGRFSDIAGNKSTKVRAGLRCCLQCRKQFTVTVGTIFEASHIPLRKWVIAWHLLAASKKGISALQIQRMLDLGSYRTAHFMMHRMLKRGIMGAFHHVSKRHLPLYLAEFDFRWNHRKTSDGERMTAGIRMCEGKRLKYWQPKSNSYHTTVYGR